MIRNTSLMSCLIPLSPTHLITTILLYLVIVKKNTDMLVNSNCLERWSFIKNIFIPVLPVGISYSNQITAIIYFSYNETSTLPGMI